MRDLSDILEELSGLLRTRYETVILSTAPTGEQFLQEVQAVNPDKLPGIIIVFDRFSMTMENTVRESAVTIVLVDRFRAASPDRSSSVLTAFDSLCRLIPADGLRLSEGELIYPADAQASGIDKAYLAIALGVTIKQ